jgi:hypothetical protein
MLGFNAIACSLVAGSYLFSQSVRANPCNDPQRLINGYTVNLGPLIEWWPQPKGLRPLPGWKHVQGSITRDTSSGWIIAGKADSKGNPSTFLIKNPPRKRLQHFQERKRQLSQCERSRDAAMEFLRRPIATDAYSYLGTPWPSPPISLAQYKEAGARLAELVRTINALHAELAPMQDKNGNFKLDAFALKLNESFEGLPVFDHGLLLTEL